MTSLLDPVNSVTIVRGASKKLALTVQDENDSPVDLTGSRLVFTLKTSLASEHPLLVKTSDDDSQILITSPTAGLAEVYILPADTKGLEPGQYVFDIWLIDSDSNHYPVTKPVLLTVQAAVTVLSS